MVLRQLQRDSARATGGAKEERDAPAYSDDGSNAWAFAPSRSTTGNAILLRNPHLQWTAGYWQAHVTVPGKLDFYGDFRIGSPFAVVAGFNNDLGWATTNNAPDRDEVYALDVDPAVADHYLFDATSFITALGPVVYRSANNIYVVRAGPDGEYRSGAQFLRMMRARNLAEWKHALAMRARATSNLTNTGPGSRSRRAATSSR